MSTVRTYFQNRLPAGELARLVLAREQFFLESIVDIDETVAAIRAHCRGNGLTSQVRKQPYNSSPTVWDLITLFPSWIGALALALFSAATLRGRQADVIITRRSNSLLEVCFSQAAANHGSALP